MISTVKALVAAGSRELTAGAQKVKSFLELTGPLNETAELGAHLLAAMHHVLRHNPNGDRVNALAAALAVAALEALAALARVVTPARVVAAAVTLARVVTRAVRVVPLVNLTVAAHATTVACAAVASATVVVRT